MRKELVIFIPSTEPEDEVAVRLSSRGSNILLISHGGHKFECDKEHLRKLIDELESFQKDNQPVEDEKVEVIEEGQIICEMFNETIVE